MTNDQARTRANALWGRRARLGVNSVGDRNGTTVLRTTKTAPDLRFEVGYYETTHVSPSGFADKFDLVIGGRGASWDDALLDATRRASA